MLGAAIAGAAVVYGSVLAAGLSGGHSNERESDQVFNPDDTRAGQHKAAIPTAGAQVIRPAPAGTWQPSPTTAGPFTATRAPMIIEAVPPSSGGSALSRAGAPGTWTPSPSRDAPEGNRPPSSSTTAPPSEAPPSEAPPSEAPPSEAPPGSGSGGSGSGDSGSGDSGSGDSGSGSDEESGGDGTNG